MKRRFGRIARSGLPALTALCLLGAPTLLRAQEETTQEDEAEDEGASYEDVITEEAISSVGLFSTHMIGEDLFFEVPLDLLGREILVVTRQARVPDGVGYGGSKANTSTVRWERMRDRMLLRLVSHNNTASEEAPVSGAVRNSNFEPIVASFDIETFSDDSSSVVIEATSLFTSDVRLMGLPSFTRERLGVRSVDRDRSYIVRAAAYPRNVEVRRVLTYVATEAPSSSSASNTVSLEMNHSMLLLPDEPMQPRLCDERVGYFSTQSIDYGIDAQRAESRCFVTRWRLEPSDTAAFLRGELVDPVKPIVYYIDPATPPKWAPYLKQGVEDWQAAFERAGFSNAIVARDAPADDPDWSPEDARYSVIRYLASPVQNASGPHVHDPRTGEILESDIQWYHNVMNLLRNWFFVQTAAVNEDARGVSFPDEVMGELIRFVSAHEVGHTIGLPHNMQSSSAYSVEQLRTRFVCEMGVSPSIMDYARFNYVAQPGDDTCLLPLVGPYDLFSVEWGYRSFPGEDEESEQEALRRMVEEKQRDPVYRFSSPNGMDPSALTEAIGDDAVAASDYGVANLKRIVRNLREWSSEPGEDYSQLQELYGNVVSQWTRYTGHVAANLGGVVRTRKRQGQDGPQYEMVPERMQRRAMDYINRQVFETPEWLLDADILDRFQPAGTLELVQGRQAGALRQLLNVDRMARLVEQEAFHGDDAYRLGEMLRDLRAGVWTELERGEAPDPYRRNLQRAWIARMEELLEDEDAQATDAAAFARGELDWLASSLESALDSAPSEAARLHYADAMARSRKALRAGESSGVP